MSTIIITGASKGIGLATVRRLVDLKANIVCVSRSKPAELADLIKSNPNQIQHVEGDVRDDAINQRAVNLAVDTYGALDGLILNAGIIHPIQRIADLGENGVSEFRKLFDINFFSLVSIVQYAIPHLRKSSGRVIFVSSGAATKAYTGMSAYCSSKAALNHLCICLAKEESKIAFLAVRPGVVETDMQILLREGEKVMDKDDRDKFFGLYERGELLSPEIPAKALAEGILSFESKYSGQFLDYSDEKISTK